MQTELPIIGMMCEGCAQTVEEQLSQAPGVTKAHVDFATKIASVEFDPAKTRVAQLIAAVEQAGYQVQSV